MIHDENTVSGGSPDRVGHTVLFRHSEYIASGDTTCDEEVLLVPEVPLVYHFAGKILLAQLLLSVQT